MRIAAAFDHRGVKLRGAVLEAIEAAGHNVVDLGTDTDAVRIDYTVDDKVRPPKNNATSIAPYVN